MAASVVELLFLRPEDSGKLHLFAALVTQFYFILFIYF